MERIYNELPEYEKFKKIIADLIEVMYDKNTFPLEYLTAPEKEIQGEFTWKIMGK